MQGGHEPFKTGTKTYWLHNEPENVLGLKVLFGSWKNKPKQIAA